MEETDLSEQRKQCLTNLYVCAENLAKYIDSDEDKQIELEKLQQCLLRYCIVDVQKDVIPEAMEQTKAETDASNIDTFKERYQMHLKQLARTPEQMNNHPYVLEFNQRYQNALASVRSAMTEDSDIAINETLTQQLYIDPYSKQPITDPVKNTLCGHYYEKDTIMKIIQRNNRTRCPVAGCGNRNYITSSHLMSDEELRFRLSIPVHSTMIQD